MTTMTHESHIVHTELPSGFNFADSIQSEHFERTGSVNGASKVCLVRIDGVPQLAVRLRPPRTLDDVRSPDLEAETVEEYIKDYGTGWRDAQADRTWDHDVSNAYDDGFMDRAAGRIKWHTTYCESHDECGA